VRYSYTVLRYVHDPSRGEFINVGVIVLARDQRYFGSQLRVPRIDCDAFKSSMHVMDRALKELKEGFTRGDLFRHEGDALTLARSVLPEDDSSLQWSPAGGGLTADPAATLDHLFKRLVSDHRSGEVAMTDTLRIGIAPPYVVSARMAEITRGEQLDQLAPTIWISSFDELAKAITPQNLWLIKVIAKETPQSIKEVALRASRTTSDVTRALSRLEKLGFVEVIVHDDGRKQPRALWLGDRIELDLQSFI
jgi:predicted transcriptional regulator